MLRPLKAEISSILGLRIIPSSAKHLGLPLFFHRSKSQDFEDLKLRIFGRISGGKQSCSLKQPVRLSLNQWPALSHVMQCLSSSCQVLLPCLDSMMRNSGGAFHWKEAQSHFAWLG
ncbi:hypothetical protein SLA2020_426870 [Shorea laevis]